MLENLMIAALVVVALWVIIIALYLTLARRQPDIAEQMKALEAQLDRVEQDKGRS